MSNTVTAADADTLLALYGRWKDAPTGKEKRAAGFQLKSWLCSARDAGYTLQSLADVLGVTRQRVQQMAPFAAQVADVPPVEGPVTPAVDLPWPRVVRNRSKAWPRPTLSDTERDRLVELQRLASETRGWTPLDDPRRKAGDELAATLNRLMDEQGFSYLELAGILGITKAGVRARLKNRGFKGGTAPSQRGYQGKLLKPGGARRASAPIEHGTRRGYGRCVRRPEGSCEECRAAERDYFRSTRGRPPVRPMEAQWKALSDVQKRMMLVLSEVPRRSNPSREFSHWVPSSKALSKRGLLADGTTLSAEGSALMVWVRENLEIETVARPEDRLTGVERGRAQFAARRRDEAAA